METEYVYYKSKIINHCVKIERKEYKKRSTIHVEHVLKTDTSFTIKQSCNVDKESIKNDIGDNFTQITKSEYNKARKDGLYF